MGKVENLMYNNSQLCPSNVSDNWESNFYSYCSFYHVCSPPPLLSPPGGDSHFRRVGVLVIVGHYTEVIDILYVTDHP